MKTAIMTPDRGGDGVEEYRKKYLAAMRRVRTVIENARRLR